MCSPMHDDNVRSEGNPILFKDLCMEDGDKDSDPESSIDPSIPIPDHKTDYTQTTNSPHNDDFDAIYHNFGDLTINAPPPAPFVALPLPYEDVFCPFNEDDDVYADFTDLRGGHDITFRGTATRINASREILVFFDDGTTEVYAVTDWHELRSTEEKKLPA